MLSFCLQNKTVTEEVYFTHWYEMPPKYRKIIHIYLGQTRREFRFTYLQIYPLKMRSFAKALHFIYSVTNVLRTSFRTH